jgi:hypothetical protein
VLNNGSKTMSKNTPLDNQKVQIKEILLEKVKKEKPQTTTELINLIQEETGLTKNEITKLLIALENEDKLCFTKRQTSLPSTAKEIIFFKQTAWYWITIAIALATTISVFTIPENSPITLMRLILGFVFVLFLPGYAFTKMLFQKRLPLVTGSSDLDNIERIGLSLITNLALTVIVGLILNYTPWGIRLTSMTFSLLGLTVIFAAVALLRENQPKPTQTSDILS